MAAPRLGYRLWINVRPWYHIIGTAPKCGTRSLYEGLYKQFPRVVSKNKKTLEITFHDPNVIEALRPGQAAAYPGAKTWFVRHPWDRFMSLWRQKVRDGGHVQEKWTKVLAGMTPRDLFEFIQQHENWHWMPQHELAGFTSGVSLVKLENMSRWWQEQTGKPLKRENVTTPELADQPYDPYLEDEVVEYYERDLELWNIAA